ncbi:MAG TPA: type II secretion system F family protein [Terriglobales bacterium]|nr:type II secretion system F family protein [Terriglobales bacterium]
MKTLPMTYISSFCLSLHLAAASGIPLSEGVLLFAQNEPDTRLRTALSGAYDALERGKTLFETLRETGLFPAYMTDMVEAGERTGKLDEVLVSLSAYYDRQHRMARAIRGAVLYPLVLLAVILMVTALFVVKVLPIFDGVYAQLGASMSGPALFMLSAGRWMSQYSAPLLIALFVAAAAICFLLSDAARRAAAGRALCRLLGAGDLAGLLSSARFSSVMSMALSSGMEVDDALEMTGRLTGDDAPLADKLARCRERLAAGEGFAPAVAEAGILPALYTRMLSVGVRAGSTDAVMAEIARRAGEEAEGRIDGVLGRVEPALVILMSLLVGLILLSVMLPLASIMSAL